MAQQVSFASVIESAAKLPLVRIDREEFLTKNLTRLCTPEQLQKAITEGTLHADIPIATLDSLANAVINAETVRVTAISTAAGISGGFAIIATIPADLTQFYGFILRAAQELAYLYGWDEIFTESSELDIATESQLVLFVGVMSGVGLAADAVTKLFGERAMEAVAKKVAAQALTKTWYYPIAKKIAARLGYSLTKQVFAKGVSKTVPLVGGVISGGLTLAMFKPMAHRLQRHLSTMAKMSPEQFAEYEASIIIDEADSGTVDQTVEAVAEEVATNYWTCTCGAINKGRSCSECGQEKPAAIPQYRCDKCGWEPDYMTRPPKYCPDCGDQFDDGDIVLV